LYENIKPFELLEL